MLPLQPPRTDSVASMKLALCSATRARDNGGDLHSKSSASVYREHKWRLCPKLMAADHAEQLQIESQSCVPALGWTVTCHAASHAPDRKRSANREPSVALRSCTGHHVPDRRAERCEGRGVEADHNGSRQPEKPRLRLRKHLRLPRKCRVWTEECEKLGANEFREAAQVDGKDTKHVSGSGATGFWGQKAGRAPHSPTLRSTGRGRAANMKTRARHMSADGLLIKRDSRSM